MHTLIIALLYLLASPVIAAAQPGVQQIILYKNAQVPFQGNPNPNWGISGNAYTAQTFYMPFDQLKASGSHFSLAKLLIVWQARSPDPDAGVAMFACPPLSDASHTDLPTTCVWWTFFAGNDKGPASYTPGCAGTGSGPHPCTIDVTDALNALISGGEVRVPDIPPAGCQSCKMVTFPGGVPYYLTIGSHGDGTNGPYVYDVELSVTWR